MPLQLIFTSAPAGLDLGRSGFCTVARDAAVRDRLLRELERTSSYEPPRGRSPAVHRHRRLTAGGDTWHVLTRIVGGGRDYSGRTNYVAHHVVLAPGETAGLPSPAEVLERWTGWRDAWEGPPRVLGAEDGFRWPPVVAEVRPKAVPRLSGGGGRGGAVQAQPVLPARAWAEFAGDAGVAAALAECRAPLAARVVPAAGADDRVLRLYREAQALLPAALAWQVTFTTAFLAHDAPKDFCWVGGAEDLPGLGEPARWNGAAVFRQGGVAPVPPAGLLAQLARHGRARLEVADVAWAGGVA